MCQIRKISIVSGDCIATISSFNINFGNEIVMDHYFSSLSGMPRMFWDPGFRLSHPDTFTQVFPFFTSKSTASSKSENSSPTHATSSSSKLVQERLAHHLDLVEVDIADQVAQKSHHFFEVSNMGLLWGQNYYNGNYHSEYRPLPFRVPTSASQRATREKN